VSCISPLDALFAGMVDRSGSFCDAMKTIKIQEYFNFEK
jgi:hypothetical protein